MNNLMKPLNIRDCIIASPERITPYKELAEILSQGFKFLRPTYQDAVMKLNGMLIDIELVKNQHWNFERTLFYVKTKEPSIKILECYLLLIDSYNQELKSWELDKLDDFITQVMNISNSKEYKNALSQICGNKKRNETKADFPVLECSKLIYKFYCENPNSRKNILNKLSKELGIKLAFSLTAYKKFIKRRLDMEEDGTAAIIRANLQQMAQIMEFVKNGGFEKIRAETEYILNGDFKKQMAQIMEFIKNGSNQIKVDDDDSINDNPMPELNKTSG